MTDYREISRLRSLGLNHSQIAESVAASRPTVIGVLRRAQALELDWQTAESLSDGELAEKLNPSGGGKPTYKMPDYEYVHRELAKPGMTQQLLWFEYCDRCRAAGEVPIPAHPVQNPLPRIPPTSTPTAFSSASRGFSHRTILKPV